MDVLKKAKQEYSDLVRGRDYQNELINKIFDENVSGKLELYQHNLDLLFQRRDMFVGKIALLEDIFGTKLLQGEE